VRKVVGAHTDSVCGNITTQTDTHRAKMIKRQEAYAGADPSFLNMLESRQRRTGESFWDAAEFEDGRGRPTTLQRTAVVMADPVRRPEA
jgi:hypothetical protein